MESPRSLTRAEAEERAALISVGRYDIDIDMTGLPDGPDWKCVSTMTFTCREPGAATFVDAVLDVVSATLNGTEVPREQIEGDRIALTDLAEQNTLVVEAVQRETQHGEWVHRAVDPSDKEVYVWTSFEPDDARRAWACFDQPDLKAPHKFVVTAPARWRVVSNSGDPEIEDVEDGKRWTFPDTPPLSTYVPVVNAGPFYELRSERAGYDLGLLTRQSLAQFLDRDAEELFEVTGQGLAFFGDRFGMPFPQAKYDQVFLPDMGGAMENYGCVSWTDAVIFRSPPTHAEREMRALILLHEMAHMWFGDIVTMQWWDNLWLNEAFAEWACHWAAEGATSFTDAWSGFLAASKQYGYSADMAPTTHPIRQPVNDVAEATASFDGITYPKGASVLKQLFAFVGEDACVEGLRAYFAKHAWGNTTLDDLMSAIGDAAGRDLSDWTRAWLDTAGTDRLTLERRGDQATLVAVGPDDGAPRPHRLDIGIYSGGDGSLVRERLLSLETDGAETPVPDVGQADLLLINDEDLTFASVRPDAASLDVLLSSAAGLPSAVSRGIAVTTAWNMLMYGELSTADFLRCQLEVLRHETAESVVEPYLTFMAVDAAENWSPDAQREELLSQVADTAIALLDTPAHRKVAIRTLASTAVTDEQLKRLQDLVGDDADLQWRALIRRAEVSTVDKSEVDTLLNTDLDPDAWVRALAVDAAKPDADLKEAAWQAVIVERRIPIGSLGDVRRAFWRRSQDELLAPYGDRYLELLPTLHTLGMIPALSISNAMFPRAGVGLEFAERAVAAAKADGVAPVVRRTVIENVDRLRRMEKARSI
jgi:aminopeptidase N